MNAVDTNVLVRLLTEDNRKQAAAARALFAADPVWIAKSVLLETNWVLHRLYNFEETAIQAAFVKLLGLPNVEVEDKAAVFSALDLAGKGLELADALHLSSRPADAVFVSFDQTRVRRAHRAGVTNIQPA